MIVDAHAHAWRRWPYAPAVPDPEGRGSVAQLLWHMGENGVDHAVLIAAAIGDNPDNTADLVAAAEAVGGGRLTVFADLECVWSPAAGTPGAADRLAAAIDRWAIRGFTTYLAETQDGSALIDAEGEAFFALAERRGLIASLSLMPHQMDALAKMAARHPALPILLHHQMYFGPRSATGPESLAIAHKVAAASPNVFVKLSGPGNIAAADAEYPYRALRYIGAGLLGAFSSARLVWGSDFPVSARHMTYRQSLDCVRRHGPPGADLGAILGQNMARLLGLGAA
ncbi:MAG: amidohydrolase family protein [Acuticoccus sp.]